MPSIRPSAPAPYAFNVMVKPRGSLCNLACDYCYYLDKEQLYPGSQFHMADAVLEQFTREYIDAQRELPEVTFAWQGGEPTLMGIEFFQRAVELQARYRPPGMRIGNALQTNATALDDMWCRFLHKHGFLVGVSLDGPRELHDAFRSDKGGAPTFDRVMRGIELLKEHGVEFNILTTVHAANASRPLDVYRFLRDEVGARFIQFIPIVESTKDSGRHLGAVVSDRSVSGRAYGALLCAIFDEWVRRDVGQVFVQVFDAALGAWLGQGASLCVFSETCGAALVLEHNGDLYACDHFVEPRHRLGNIAETPLAELVSSGEQRRFGLYKRDALPAFCRACDVRFVCNGGCPKDRLLCAPDGEAGLNYLCEGYRAFFKHVDRPMRMMVELAHAQRAPSDVMFVLARERAETERLFARAGRNDPCPCGSGRKFKQCHGQVKKGAS